MSSVIVVSLHVVSSVVGGGGGVRLSVHVSELLIAVVVLP